MRQAAPETSAEATWREGPDGWRLAAAAIEAVAPAEALAGIATPRAGGQGIVPLSFYKPADGDAFRITADFTGTTLWWGDVVRKEPGVPARMRIEGLAAPAWRLTDGNVELAGQEVDFQMEAAGLSVPAFDVALGPLSALLANGMTVDGRIRGLHRAEAQETELLIEGASVLLASGEGFDAIDGRMVRRSGVTALENVRLRGANSSAVLDAAVRDGRWIGRFAGETLDLNAVQRLYEAVREVFDTRRADEDREPAEAVFDLAFDELHYRGARIEAASAQVVRDRTGTHVRSIVLGAPPGNAAGSVSVLTVPGEAPNQIDVSLELQGVDARLLDRLLFAEPRGLRGRVDGNLAFTAPALGGDEAVKQANGTATMTARDGTFGRLGFATQLLAVLRNLEILQLRLPVLLRDEGLVFEECVASLRIEDGLMTIDEWILDSRVYGLEAAGTVNFPEDATNVAIRVNLVGSITRITDRVPLVGSVVGRVTDITHLRLLASGSPYDVRIRPDPGARLDGLTGRTPTAAPEETASESRVEEPSAEPLGE